MRRREFLAATASVLAVGESGYGWQTDAVATAKAPREPDIVVKKHSGCMAFSPDSKRLAVANGSVGDKEGICFLDPTTGKRLPDFERTTDISTRLGRGWPAVLAFSVDGEYFAAGGEGYIALWDATSGKRLDNLELPSANLRAAFGTVTVLAFSPDSQYVFAGRRFWPIRQGGQVREVEGLDATDGIAFSPDGKQFATRREGIITLWSYPKLHKQKTFGVRDPSAGPLLYIPNGTMLISEQVYIDQKPYFAWNIETGAPRYIPFEYKPGFYMDLSPDGTLIGAATNRGIVTMSVDTGRATYILQVASGLQDEGIFDVKFAPNQQILVCSQPSGIRIWKENNGFKS
jgi:WD40 repeat protein